MTEKKMEKSVLEAKRAEEVLWESEYFFRESQRAAFIGSYKTDFTAGFWESSEVLDQIFGIDRNYSRSVQGWIEIVHPDDREMMDRYLREEVISKRKPFNKEYRIIRKSDGEIRWVNGLGEVDFDTEGKIISMIGTIQDITEQKQLEEALQESEERFRTLFEGAPDAIFLADPETGIIIDANSKASELTALPHEKIIGLHQARLHPPRIEEYSIDTFKKHAMKKKQKGENHLFENFVLRPDGTEVAVEVLAQIVNINGRPILQGVFRDITERKRTEDKLRKSKESFSKAEKIGHFGYWEWNLATNKIEWSDEVFRLYGLDPQKVVPTYETVISTLSAETREWFIKAVGDALNNNDPFEGEYSLIRPDGNVRYTHTIGEVIRDRDGKPISMFGVVQDITEHKQAEEELLKFKLGIERSDEVIFITNIDGSIIYINPAFEKIYGYSREEALGKTPRILKSGLLPSEAYKTFWDTLLEKKVVNGELINKTKDGRLLNIGSSANPILNDKGNTVGFLAIQRDITERKLAEEQIKKSLKEKEVLLREIHHRVKNNMQIVSSLLMLQSQNIEDKKYKDMFIESQNRIYSMALIHEKLYQSESIAEINFKEYINGIVTNIFESYGQKSNIKIDINVENILIKIDYAVPCGLIINELVTNSLKYAFPDGRQGKIQISLKSNDTNMIQLSISDDGIGIPKDLDIRNTKSLGLHLITALAESQLHGEIILNREIGTEFQIIFRQANDRRKTDTGR
jgi:PAS domain S-box-containing protein